MPRRRRWGSLWRSDYVVWSGVANAVRRADVLFGGGDSFLAIELAIVALDGITLFLVAAIPVAGDLAGALAGADSERECERQSHGAEQNRESSGHDLGGYAELLERHEDSEDDDAALSY